MIRKMTKEEAMAHMMKMMERVPSEDLQLHLEAIAKVLATRQANELKDKNLVYDLSHLKVMQ